MCIPHGMSTGKDNGYVEEKKEKKHISKPSEEMMKRGDPDFVDERHTPYEKSSKGGLFARLLKSFGV